MGRFECHRVVELSAMHRWYLRLPRPVLAIDLENRLNAAAESSPRLLPSRSSTSSS